MVEGDDALSVSLWRRRNSRQFLRRRSHQTGTARYLLYVPWPRAKLSDSRMLIFAALSAEAGAPAAHGATAQMITLEISAESLARRRAGAMRFAVGACQTRVFITMVLVAISGCAGQGVFPYCCAKVLPTHQRFGLPRNHAKSHRKACRRKTPRGATNV